ncbi:hypothetical protein [Bordetella holmesii]|uniref:Uncharacterized protein n=2 Tax=Bordetella holmesii TaxID=35814 RepID=A0A158MB21_9BORD|nr:hypothetical protein [Bordetella holmesii]AHV92489.1 hypothetical protein D560_2757 [Bordetella holmesii ATCC 51541]AIT27393.1 hypothetical protein D558_2736 [Bordetella holmesii 44057]EWM41876.1 hypothetical protein D556_2732 [Bordetella holmesii 41130]EWM47983.1 hypothetical protein D555_2778 [Bordetella holmesii 35009]EWM48960.1 hypothetical protein D557_2027 [Bordetella holmesii 70147]
MTRLLRLYLLYLGVALTLLLLSDTNANLGQPAAIEFQYQQF